MPKRPLAGFRVVDLTVDRGELCGRLFADLGAEVVRVEPPGGSPSRRLPPRVGDHSLFFTFRNCGKRSVVLDLDDEGDRARLHELCRHSDVLIDSAEPGVRRGTGLDADELADRHPHLVVCSITAYGRTGPYAGRDVPDTVVEATGGMAFKAGLPDREPLVPPGVIADDTASTMAAFAVLCALRQRAATGWGQVIDVSANEAVAQICDWSLPNATRMRDAGMPVDETRAGPGPVYTIIPCRDGYVRLVVLSTRQWHAMRAWMGEPDYLQDPEYDSFMGRFAIADAVLNPLYAAHFADMTMVEVSEEAQRRGIVCTPILPPAEVLSNAHFASRGTFDEVVLDDGSVMKLASGFFEYDGERVGPVGPPPREPGEHTGAVFAELGEPRPAPSGPRPEPAPPLADLTVMDFGHGGVGVETGRLFAEYGADVVKIESRSYPDFIRVVLGGEMSPSFSSSSRTKRSFGVDLKSPRGRELLLALVEGADVVIENNSTGTMERLGLAFDDLAVRNPDLVMMSSQLMGSRGLWADWRGYGPNTQVTGGMTHLWNYEDLDEPAGSQAIFPDHFAGRVGAVASLAAVVGRERGTTTGTHAEVCQVEQVVAVMADLLARESLEPGSVGPRGNHSDRGVPWGLYPCAGDDRWVALCVRDDAEWAALVEVMGRPSWATDARLATVEGRREAEAAVDEGVAAWTSTLDRYEVTGACVAAGVPAGPLLTALDQLDDPHFAARGFAVWLDQPPIGRLALEGAAFTATAMSGPRITPAPLLGEHTREIARSELGLSDAEIDELIAEGVLEISEPGGSPS